MTNPTDKELLELAQNRISELEAMLRKKLDLIRCGIGANYSGDPNENILYVEAYNLLNKPPLKLGAR